MSFKGAKVSDLRFREVWTKQRSRRLPLLSVSRKDTMAEDDLKRRSPSGWEFKVLELGRKHSFDIFWLGGRDKMYAHQQMRICPATFLDRAVTPLEWTLWEAASLGKFDGLEEEVDPEDRVFVWVFWGWLASLFTDGLGTPPTNYE